MNSEPPTIKSELFVQRRRPQEKAGLDIIEAWPDLPEAVKERLAKLAAKG